MESALTPQACYRADLQRDGFYPDAAQQRAVGALQQLHQQLLLLPLPPSGWWQRLTRSIPAATPGLYLWGGPGRGKTYLMDRFFDSLPFTNKRRVHFHRFMLEVHEALDALPVTPNPLTLVAAELANRYRIICLDEFHVTDIADAMLLAGLLEALFQQNLTLVATSNIEPANLYRDGLQRSRFLPAIDLIYKNTHIIELNGAQDFRLAMLRQTGTLRTSTDASSHQWLEDHFMKLVPAGSRQSAEIILRGRVFAVKLLAQDVSWFTFTELCEKPRSAGDFLEIAREFHTLLLQGVPQLNEDYDEAARRFMHLIDALYDHGVKLIMTADEIPERLYSGSQLAEGFQRTASRLVEMASEPYLARPHRPD